MKKLIVLLLFCALLTSLFAGGVNEKAEEKDYIVMAIPVDPDGLDPMATAAASTFQVTSNIYETLITVDENGRLQFKTEALEADARFDEIGSALKIKQIQSEKRELLESLEMYYRVFFLGDISEELSKTVDNGD